MNFKDMHFTFKHTQITFNGAQFAYILQAKIVYGGKDPWRKWPALDRSYETRKRTFSPSPVSHVLRLATPAPLTRSSKLALYKSCNNNNNNNNNSVLKSEDG